MNSIERVVMKAEAQGEEQALNDVEKTVLTYREKGFPLREIAQLAGISVSTTKRILRKHGLTKKPPPPWTDSEIKFLTENYTTSTAKSIAEKLGRSICSVYAVAEKLRSIKIKSWSGEEIQFLKDNYGKIDSEEIALKLGRSYDAVIRKATQLKLSRLPREQLNLSETDKAYIAGILDGEGSISAIKTNCSKIDGYGVKLAVCYNTYQKLIETLRRKIPTTWISVESRENPKHRMRWSLNITNPPDILHLLEQLLPYLVVKRRQAECAIEFLKLRMSKPKRSPYTAEEIALWKMIKEENGRNGRGRD
jgi:DNA-binding CsgD family transcriptional regulator